MIARPDPRLPPAFPARPSCLTPLQNAPAMTAAANARSDRPSDKPCLRTAVLGLFAVAAPLVGCVPHEPPPVDPAALQRIEREGTDTRYTRLAPLASPDYYLNPRDRNDPRNYNPSPLVRAEVAAGSEVSTGEVGLNVPTTQPTTQPASSTLIYLPLQECIQRATVNNFDVAVAAYAPAIAETRVVEALARFDPTFRATAEYQDQTGINQAENIFTDTRRLTLGSSIGQLLPSGGNLELEYRALRNDIEQASLFSPVPAGVTWTSDLSLRLTQPLLRDFGYDVNRARIFVNQNDQRISVLDFRSNLEEVLLQVEQTYWQLYRAQQEVQFQSALLDKTIETADRIEKRRIADASRAQVSQALRAVYLQRAELQGAKAAVAQLSDQLKALINDPDLPIGGETLVLPATEPVLEPLLFDLQSAVEVAFTHRPELSQQLLRIINAGRILGVAESNRLPRLDMLLSGGFGGFDDDYTTAVEEQFNFDNLNIGAGLQLEIPLGNRAARSVLRRSKLEREQAVTQYQALTERVKLEVSQAQRNVSEVYARMLQLRQARLAARDAVEQAELLEESGTPLTPQFSDLKLRYLSELSQALSLEAQAVSDYNIAIAEYERAKGTLLRYNNVVLQELGDFSKLPLDERLNK